MINMAAILLTAANKGFWKAAPDTIRDLANTLGLLVVRYGPSCSAHVCGNYQTIEWSRQWMNPVLASSYSRAMNAALRGSGYPGAQPVFTQGASASGRPLFDFTVDHLPNHSPEPANFVEVVIRNIRNQDWSGVFGSLLAILAPGGLVVFFARDRYYRRRDTETIRLKL